MAWYSSTGFINFFWQILGSLWFWLVILVSFLGGAFLFIWYNKKRKLKFNVVIVTGLGDGKIGLQTVKGGWFKSITMFRGMIDYKGEDVFKVKDGRQVQDASSEDYHDINGRRGLIVQRKGDDPKILVPISRFDLDEESRQAICSIAPADFRDAGNKIVEEAERETMGFFEKYGALMAVMSLGIILLICIIFIVQMQKHNSQIVADMFIEIARNGCGAVKDYVASGAP